ncbi:hypothetical protein [Altererythrobacter sp. GH1-8]|uniref:hypothetical protein n=1 Tax=Altererythrobacter sp. GH1-8 TaxID=3349333 RepID=UPI00374D3A10
MLRHQANTLSPRARQERHTISTPPINTRAIPRQATSAVAFVDAEPSEDDPLLDFVPVPHKAPRRNSITPDLQRRFIAHLAATGIVTAAARHIGKSMEAIYKLRQRPGAEGFRAAWDAAIDRGVARLEATAPTRAIQGEERMVVSSGRLVGTEIRHNEALVMFFLRNRLGARYDPAAHISPGHPVYERIRREMEAERQREANDPARIRALHESIERKVERVRLEVEAAKGAQKAEKAPEGPGPTQDYPA